MKKIIALSLLLASTAANAVQYNVAALESLSPDENSAAYGMNDNGQIVGNAYNSSSGLTEAVIWNDGVIQSLGVQGIARAVNNSGTVVGENGFRATTNTTGDGRAYKWDSVDGYEDLGDLNGIYTGAYDINDSGVITGNSFYNNQTDFGLLSMHAYRWEDGTMHDLPPPNAEAGYSRGMGINDTGAIVGRASVDTFTNSDKFMAQWDAAGVITMFDTLGGTRSIFSALNEDGVAVGWSHAAGDVKRATISYDGVNLIDLNTIINLAGTGFVSLDEATDINQAGDIVGIGTLSTGEQSAFFLSATLVPVPAAVWLFASALGLLGWTRRKRC